MYNYKKLNVWQKAIELAVDVYNLTRNFQMMKILA